MGLHFSKEPFMSTTTQPLPETLNQAQRLMDESRHREALEILSQARREQGDQAPLSERGRLHLLTGNCLVASDRGAEALAHFKRSSELYEEARDPLGQANALEQLGTAYHQRHELTQAGQSFQRAIRLFEKAVDGPGQARNLRNLGGVQIDLNNHQAAQAAYQQARVLFKEAGDQEGMASCVTNSALLLYRNPGRPAAIAEYRRAIEEDGVDHYLIYNNLGFLLTLDSQFEEAKGYLERALANLEKLKVDDDNLALTVLNLGNLEALTDNLDKADSLLRDAARRFESITPGRAVEVLLIPCHGYEDQGFERFLVAEDGHKRAVTHLNLATLLFQRGQLSEALAEGQKALEMDREQPYPLLVMGWLHLQGKDNAEATRCLRKAVGMEPNNEHYRRVLEMVNPYLSARAGRNDPCPCGSGKKFKKCHGSEV